MKELKKGQIVVMDNCSIHNFNPIENYWAVMKNQIKKIKNKFDHFIEAIDHVLIHNKNYFTS